MSDLPRLHDATLRNINLDWESGQAHLICVTASGLVAVVASAVKELRCSHTMPWGPSDSINEAVLKTAGDAKLLHVEMQSGDQIEVICENAIIIDLEELGLAEQVIPISIVARKDMEALGECGS